MGFVKNFVDNSNVWSRYKTVALIFLDYLVLWALVKTFTAAEDTGGLFFGCPYQWGLLEYISHTQRESLLFVYQWLKIISISLWTVSLYSYNRVLVAAEDRSYLPCRALR